MDPVELLREHLALAIDFHVSPQGVGTIDEWARRKHEAIALYRTLSFEQAVAIGRVLVDTYDECSRRERDENLRTSPSTVPVEELFYLAVFQPAAMRELYPEVIAHNILWSEQIFCAGDALARDALMDRLVWNEVKPGVVEDIREFSSVLRCLAWVGDDTVVAQFAAWRDVKLLWRPNAELIAINPSYAGQSQTFPLTDQTHEAGWELTQGGGRRNLYLEHWRKLMPAESPSEHGTSVKVGGLIGAACNWCGRDLAAILDLDLHAPELSFLGLSGDHLRMPVCRYCSYGGGNGPLFWRVDTDGGARWCEANGERPAIAIQYDRSREYEPAWQQVQYVSGPEQTNLYASLVPEGDFDPSRLGGLPEWVQSPDFPVCPDCGTSMRFLGQLDADQHGGWEGLIYAFLCAECQVAATVHQQT